MATVYCWSLHSPVLGAVLRQVGGSVTVCLLPGKEDLWLEKSANLPLEDLIYPLIDLGDGKVITTRMLAEHVSSASTKIPNEHIDGAEPVMPIEPIAGTLTVSIESEKVYGLPALPLVNYLDKDWVWSELLLNIVETFGFTISKADASYVPEDYMMACLQRNLGVKTMQDGHVLLGELVLNGICQRITTAESLDEYRLTYHSQGDCLNACRETVCETVLEISKIIHDLVLRVAQVSTVHSREFLEFVDALNWLRLTDPPTSNDLLVNLLFVLRSHIELIQGTSACYYEFQNGVKVSCSWIEQKLSSPETICLGHLKWTWSPKLPKLALKTYIAALPQIDQKVLHVPDFLKAVAIETNKKICYYHIH